MTADDHDERLRLLAKVTRLDADVAAQSHALAALAWGRREIRPFGDVRPLPLPSAEQGEAEDAHENLIVARRAFLDSVPMLMPRAQWTTDDAYFALKDRADGLGEVAKRDRQILRVVNAWGTADRPLFESIGLVDLMNEQTEWYGNSVAFDRLPPRSLVPVEIRGSVARDVLRGIARENGRVVRARQREDAFARSLLAAIAAHPGLAAGALEKALRVKHGALASSLAALIAAGGIVNRGTAKRPRYYIVDNV